MPGLSLYTSPDRADAGQVSRVKVAGDGSGPLSKSVMIGWLNWIGFHHSSIRVGFGGLVNYRYWLEVVQLVKST